MKNQDINIRRERNIKMKKNGFTLAEVLITLAIIGVVATMTLPALMTNTQEQQAKTGLKKGINTLTEAAQMNQAIDGFDYASLTSSDTADDTLQSMYALLVKRANVDFARSGESRLESHQGSTTAVTEGYSVFFRDGTALNFVPADTIAEDARALDDTDNLATGFLGLYDTNGSKGPNIVSNCQGAALGVDVAGDSDAGATQGQNQTEEEFLNEQCKAGQRIVKDQFMIRFRGGSVVPEGFASRWALLN